MSSKYSDDKMRSSGAGRLLCSPYFTGSAIILLSILTVRHWTISGQYEELNSRLEMLQTQMKTDKFNIQNLESTLSQKNSEIEKVNGEKSELQKQIDEKSGEVANKQSELEEANKGKSDMENQLSEVREQARNCEEQKQGISDKLNQAEGDKTQLAEKDKVIEDLNGNVARLEAELAKRPAAQGA